PPKPCQETRTRHVSPEASSLGPPRVLHDSSRLGDRKRTRTGRCLRAVTSVFTRDCPGAIAATERDRDDGPTNRGVALMDTPHPRRSRVAGLCAAFIALTLTSASATAAANGSSTATVAATGGAVHGIGTSW